MTEQFLKQTAKDYDMPLSVVKEISNKYPDQFYSKLEEYISDRAKQ